MTIGVAGELWFQSRASNKQALIRSDSHQIEGLLNKEAGDARDRAASAELQTAELRREMADRSLTLDAKERSQLEQISKQRFEIITYAGDREARKFSDLVAGALQSSGWTHMGTAPTGFDGTQPIFTGARVEFSTRAGADTQTAALLLSSVLSKEHIAESPAQRVVFPQDVNGRLPDVIRITVGVRKQAADEATGRMNAERELREQGPRWRLLEEITPTLSEQLKAFRGQLVSLVPCGRTDRIDSELNRVIADLWAMLEKGEWNRSNIKYDETCTGGASLMVFTNSEASGATLKAGRFLMAQLHQVLPFTPGSAIAARTIGNQQLPRGSVAYDMATDKREMVVVFIGPHP